MSLSKNPAFTASKPTELTPVNAVTRTLIQNQTSRYVPAPGSVPTPMPSWVPSTNQHASIPNFPPGILSSILTEQLIRDTIGACRIEMRKLGDRGDPQLHMSTITSTINRICVERQLPQIKVIKLSTITFKYMYPVFQSNAEDECVRENSTDIIGVINEIKAVVQKHLESHPCDNYSLHMLKTIPGIEEVIPLTRMYDMRSDTIWNYMLSHVNGAPSSTQPPPPSSVSHKLTLKRKMPEEESSDESTDEHHPVQSTGDLQVLSESSRAGSGLIHTKIVDINTIKIWYDRKVSVINGVEITVNGGKLMMEMKVTSQSTKVIMRTTTWQLPKEFTDRPIQVSPIETTKSTRVLFRDTYTITFK